MTIGLERRVAAEQTRARYPDQEGYVERDGVRSFYEVYGDGLPTVLLMPTWSIVHSRHWKMQIPYLARHCRVLTFDGRGNGCSDRPSEPDAYREEEYASTRSPPRTQPQPTAPSWWRCREAQNGRCCSRRTTPSGSRGWCSSPRRYRCHRLPPRLQAMQEFSEPLDDYIGWGKWNRHYWIEHYEEFLEFFFSQCFTEPHSTKQREDTVGWGLETDAETLVATQLAPRLLNEESVRALLSRIDCPILVIHGSDDAIRPWASGARLAELANGALTVLEGSGHFPHTRDPVKVNLLIRDFIRPGPPPRGWVRGRSRHKRALYISSPIGLGHAQRDAAIADELRKLHPDLEIDWLAQHPVTAVLEARGERIHPASAFLANESHHIESESAEHDLHCFQAIRRWMRSCSPTSWSSTTSSATSSTTSGSETKRGSSTTTCTRTLNRSAPYVWLTDFIGWLPMADGGDHEAFLTGDYNEEMIEHIARFPRARSGRLRRQPRRHRARAVRVTPSVDPGLDRGALLLCRIRYGLRSRGLRRPGGAQGRLGYGEDEQVCIVTVGGSGVGGDLLRRVIAAFPGAKERVPALRMIVVAGPRIAGDAA